MKAEIALVDLGAVTGTGAFTTRNWANALLRVPDALVGVRNR